MCQRLQPLKARLNGVVGRVKNFYLREQEVAERPTFTEMLAQFINKDTAEWTVL